MTLLLLVMALENDVAYNILCEHCCYVSWVTVDIHVTLPPSRTVVTAMILPWKRRKIYLIIYLATELK